ncbi:hypothetical protein D3C87_1969310 [compost metagenome]
MGPDEPVAEGIAVTDRVAERETGRMVLLLELAAEPQEAVEILREGVEARFLDP